jgi:thioredoxin 1
MRPDGRAGLAPPPKAPKCTPWLHGLRANIPDPIHPEIPEVSDKVMQVGDADFEREVLQSDVPVLVDFWAEWCGPCKMIAPALDELARDYAGRAKVVKVNVDHNRQSAMKYHVRSIPMLLVFKNGQIHGQQIGAVGKGQLAQLVEKAL